MSLSFNLIKIIGHNGYGSLYNIMRKIYSIPFIRKLFSTFQPNNKKEPYSLKMFSIKTKSNVRYRPYYFFRDYFYNILLLMIR